MRLSVLQVQWLAFALAGGLAIALLIVMTYLMIWRPRQKDSDGNVKPARGWRAAWSFTPWVLIVLYVSTIIYALTFAVAKILHPPTTW
jgi:hypothetical protein